MTLEKILKDLTHMNDLLDEYWVLIYKSDYGIPKPLTESEKMSREEILKDLKLEILRFRADIDAFSKGTCKSKKQKETENINLVDAFRTLSNVLSRLQRFGVRDPELIENFELLKSIVLKFKDVIDDYRQRSIYQIYSWSEVAKKVKEEDEATSKMFGLT